MATAFAQNHLDLVSSEEESLFKIGAKRRNSKNDDQRHDGQFNSMSPFRETKPNRHQKNVSASTKTLVDNGVLWNKFKSDLASSRSCKGLGAKAVLHEFIDKTMKDESGEMDRKQLMKRTSSAPLLKTGQEDESIGRIVSNSLSRAQRRISMTITSTFQLDDECASVNSHTNFNSSSGVEVEFDHTIRRPILSVRNSSRSNRRKSRNSASSKESLSKAACIVASMELDDFSIDDEACDQVSTTETRSTIRRGSFLSSVDGMSCLDTVVTEEDEEDSSDDDEDDTSTLGFDQSAGSLCTSTDDL